MQFLFGLAVGWWVAKNVQLQAVAAGGPGGASAVVATPSGPALVVGSSGLSVVQGPAALPANGSVGWSGCPDGQVAFQDPQTGRISCLVSMTTY